MTRLLTALPLMAPPASAHKNPYPRGALTTSQWDTRRVKTGYTAVLTDAHVFGLSEGQRLPVFFLRTEDEPALGMFSDTEMDLNL